MTTAQIRAQEDLTAHLTKLGSAKCRLSKVLPSLRGKAYTDAREAMKDIEKASVGIMWHIEDMGRA
jgi:hypothetical protein